MHFDTSDAGHIITGYFVPDSFSGESIVRVTYGNGEVLHVEASIEIPSLVDVGRHATGLCGYRIDETVIPGLASVRDLEIQAPETGLRIYRRGPADKYIRKKILRLETHLRPLTRFDQAFENLFHFHYTNIEQYGHETTAQIFQLNNSDSTYASGRFLYKPLEFFIEGGKFLTLCLIRDPFDELAERLIVLRDASEGRAGTLDTRDKSLFAPAIEFVADVDLADERQVRRAFRGMSKADAALFADPIVRTLTARTPDELATDEKAAMAMQTLSEFAVVGVRTHADSFVESVAALLNCDPMSLPSVTDDGRVLALGRILRDIRSVERLLECDLHLYTQLSDTLVKLLQRDGQERE